jgi:hypothetical protein
LPVSPHELELLELQAPKAKPKTREELIAALDAQYQAGP